MAKDLREMLEEACVRAGLDRALEREIVKRVLGLSASGVSPTGSSRARMAAEEQEIKELLGVTSREAIVPALERILERLKVLKTAAGFDSPGPADGGPA